MRVVLDTSILLHLTRSNSPFVSSFPGNGSCQRNDHCGLRGLNGGAFCTRASESMGSIAHGQVGRLDGQSFDYSVESQELIAAYAKLDVYSQGKLPGFPLPSGLSARNMGKNDLWIAATALVLEAALVTADADFAHLAPLVKVSCIN